MPALSCVHLTEAARESLKALAWQVLSDAIKHQRFILPSSPNMAELEIIATSFVTIYYNGHLRGCIGCVTASQPLWQDVCHHSYSSAFRDARFKPLQENELASLQIEISVLSPLKAINNEGEAALLDELQPNIDGLLIKDDNHSAVFLPTVWQSLPSPTQFVNELKQKGGWARDYWAYDIELYRFHTLVI
ncbi:AmmeMemoRadiSam system protein A [Psychrobium sp. 1_MG-2023]|uniref:AmmeMemoRadiSam system protein A n=1 Tax=Psychrobium sp. 1_MG-2023 TaxID=3062624 RepID=UPI000C342A9D|nr:AmmeMemoRadiSam system protein A [Psychrobium sp. 1_MG-2023]MDP2561630.1 AmmeMemoRadiSam system protein A [Psychrobium sp. 1_MG-2023]PKF55648.1 AmmeMemoRadiSam system protein A [Alteromonadales bacterium alter-6D02]